jgi:hypothetical protein
MNALKWLGENQVIVGGGIGFVLLVAGLWVNKTNLAKWGVIAAVALIKAVGKANARTIGDDLHAFADALDAEVDKPEQGK